MQKTNRSNSALGVAFVFFSLAIVPVSIRATGATVSFGPTLTAAVDVWREISGFLGDGYQSLPADPANGQPSQVQNDVEQMQPGENGCEQNRIAAVDDDFSPVVRDENRCPIAPLASSKPAAARQVAVNRGRSTSAGLRDGFTFEIAEPVVEVESAANHVRVTLQVPSFELRNSLHREIARRERELNCTMKALGFSADSSLKLKLEPATAPPAPPVVSTCNSTKSNSSETKYEFHFQTRSGRPTDARVIKLISGRARAFAELLRRTA